MYFVLLLHVHGFIFIDDSLQKAVSFNGCIGWVLEYLAMVAVNCFVMITGYLYITKENSLGRCINLWLQVFFYSVLLAAVCFVFGRKISAFTLPRFTDISIIDFISSFFPVFRNRYWFFTEYCGLLVLIPVLNCFAKNIDRTVFRKFLLCGFICFSILPTALLTDVFNLGNGYSTLWFLYLYLCGAYIKLYKTDYKTSKYLAVYLVTALLSAAIRIFLEYSNIIVIGHNVNKLGRFVSNYNQPLVFVSAVSLFLVCKNIKVENSFMKKLVAAISPLCFSVYLIHLHVNFGRPWFAEDNFVRSFLYDAGMQNIWLFLLINIGGSFVIFSVCCIVDFLRLKLFQALKIRKKCDALGNLISKAIFSLADKVLKE